MTNAPYLGEAALLFSLTRTPRKEAETTTGGQMPILVYLALAVYLVIGNLIMLAAIVTLKRWKRQISKKPIPLEKMQLAIWGVLVIIGAALCAMHHFAIGLILVLSAQFLPRSYGRTVRETKKNCV